MRRFAAYQTPALLHRMHSIYSYCVLSYLAGAQGTQPAHAHGIFVGDADVVDVADGTDDGVRVGVWLGALVGVLESDALAVLVVLAVGVPERDGVTEGVGVGVAVVVGNADGAGAAAEQPCRRVDNTVMCTSVVPTDTLVPEPTFVMVTRTRRGLWATTRASQMRFLLAAAAVRACCSWQRSRSHVVGYR